MKEENATVSYMANQSDQYKKMTIHWKREKNALTLHNGN
jgi:hypothetical protein